MNPNDPRLAVIQQLGAQSLAILELQTALATAQARIAELEKILNQAPEEPPAQ